MGRDQCAQPHFTSYRALVLEAWFQTVYIGSLGNLIVLRDPSWFPELESKWTRHLHLRSIIHIKDSPIACDLSLGHEDHMIDHPSNLVDFLPSSTRHKDAECMQLISWIALGPSWLYIYYCTPCGAQGHCGRGNRCVSHCSSSIHMILIRAFFVCLCNGNSIWVKGIKLYEWPMGEQEAGHYNRKFGSQARLSCRWLNTYHNQTIRCPLRLSSFFTTSTISGIPATNVSSQYRIPRPRGSREATETSTKSSKPHQAFSRPYHWPRQCREDNHPPASLPYNGTAENFQSGGSRGVPCSRHHYLTLLTWIDWLVQAHSNCKGNASTVTNTFYSMYGREESMILRMKWYSRAMKHLSFMTHVVLKQAEHWSWIKLRTLWKSIQQEKMSGIFCM